MVMAYNLPEDLLECSVCLEALDEGSKALPCQHTFCKKCLRGVLTSKGYLQCPECRTDYPNTSIDNLPPNILLMRILGGISKSSVKNGKKNCTKENNKSASKSAEGNKFKRSIENITIREPHARAMYNFDGLEEIDLKFKKGDTIYLYQQFDENWYEGALNGKRGDVPASFIKVLVPIPNFDAEKNKALARALYNFIDKRDEDFIIRFRKGDILNVIKKIDDNWGEGILGDQHGIFPFNFVELNDVAKEKLANEKSSDEDESGDPCDSPTEGREEAQEENVSPWVRLEPPRRHNLNHEKVEEDNSQSARRSLEFSPSSDTTDASTTVAAKQLPRRASGSLLLETRSAPMTTSVSNKSSSEAKQLRRTSSRSSRPRPRSEEELGSRNWDRHPDLYIALFNYAQSRSDELALIQGEQYVVTEKFLDGWYRGFHVRSRQSGMFPGNYVGPVYTANGLQMKPVGSLPAASSPTAVHPHYHRAASSPLAGTSFLFPSVPAGGRGRSQRQRSGSEPTDPVQLTSVPMTTGTCNDRAAGRPENSFFNWKKYFKRQALQPPPYPLATQNQSNQRPKRASRPPPIPVEPPPPYSPPATSVPLSIPITIPISSTSLTSPILPDHTHERYRVVASFPPQSQQELELKVGDVLIVVKKRSDGWFQGKSQRTGKIGLFPASFVERF